MRAVLRRWRGDASEQATSPEAYEPVPAPTEVETFTSPVSERLRGFWSRFRLPLTAGLTSMAVHAVLLLIAAVTLIGVKVTQHIVVQASWNKTLPLEDELPKEAR